MQRVAGVVRGSQAEFFDESIDKAFVWLVDGFDLEARCIQFGIKPVRQAPDALRMNIDGFVAFELLRKDQTELQGCSFGNWVLADHHSAIYRYIHYVPDDIGSVPIEHLQIRFEITPWMVSSLTHECFLQPIFVRNATILLITS